VPKYGRGAVDRNRLKRRLRDIVRQGVLPFLPPVDVVIRVRPIAYLATFAELQGQCDRLRARVVASAGS
jgi:ribonuclease P protein component